MTVPSSTADDLDYSVRASVLIQAETDSDVQAVSHRSVSLWSDVPPWTTLDTVLLSAAVTYFLIFAHICARGRIFWEDEMLAWVLLRDPSFSHMLAGWRHGDDGGGIAFYLTGRAWFNLFGSSLNSFRAYSQVCFSSALVFCWLTMRRFYTPLVVAASILCVWLISPEIAGHMIEGRFYGLLTASFAWGTWLCLRSTYTSRVTRGLYAATFIAHLLITSSHVLGVVYSGALLGTIVLLDRSKQLWRPRLYCTVLASWLILIPSSEAIRASAAVGIPHFWTTQPTLLFFLVNYTGFSRHLLALFTIAFAMLLWNLSSRQGRRLITSAASRRPAVYIYVGFCFSMPVLFFIEGFFAPPLCISRYLLPIILATMFAAGELLTLLRAAYPLLMPTRPLAVAAASVLAFSSILTYDFGYLAERMPLHKDYRPALAKELPAGKPLVCEDAFAFTEFQSPSPSLIPSCLFLLDWSNSLSPRAPLVEVTQYHLMENWKQSGYYSKLIQDREAWLRGTPDFYTVTFSDVTPKFLAGPVTVERLTLIGSDLHTRLRQDPRYRVALYKTVYLGQVNALIWHICEVGPTCL